MKIDLKFEKCETCKHFLQHYIIRDLAFKKTWFGHCVNRQLNGGRVRNKYALRENCEFWEEAEDENAERIESVKEALAYMQAQLHEIACILKDDEE